MKGCRMNGEREKHCFACAAKGRRLGAGGNEDLCARSPSYRRSQAHSARDHTSRIDNNKYYGGVKSFTPCLWLVKPTLKSFNKKKPEKEDHTTTNLLPCRFSTSIDTDGIPPLPTKGCGFPGKRMAWCSCSRSRNRRGSSAFLAWFEIGDDSSGCERMADAAGFCESGGQPPPSTRGRTTIVDQQKHACFLYGTSMAPFHYMFCWEHPPSQQKQQTTPGFRTTLTTLCTRPAPSPLA